MSYKFEDSFRAGPGWNSMVHLVGFIIKKSGKTVSSSRPCVKKFFCSCESYVEKNLQYCSSLALLSVSSFHLFIIELFISYTI
jgi:hypothetical protein